MRDVDIAIVGGGFAGAAVAYHLARVAPGVAVCVVEPRQEIGRGLAYDSSDPSHRINVPAERMSLLPDDGEHFARWVAENGVLGADPGALGRDGRLYPRRSAFGSYVARQLAPLLADGRMVHLRQRVLGIKAAGQRWRLDVSGGSTLTAGAVVIAATHPPNTLPSFAQNLNDARLIRDPLVADALADVAPSDRVLIVGTGLTMADVVASLDARGHRGRILAVSRHGLRSRGHAAERADPFGEFATPAPRSAVALLKRVRAAIAAAEATGIRWHAVLDAVREQAQTFWPGLSVAQQKQIVRHLRTYWDVHRFRVAPQLEDVIDRRIAEGTLSVRAASVVQVRARQEALDALLRPRRRRDSEIFEADRIVLATGPAHAGILSTYPFLASLAAEGIVQSDPLGLGLWCDRTSRLLGENGEAARSLFVAGPLARGTYGELMGLPQVSQHAADVAGWVAAYVATSHVHA